MPQPADVDQAAEAILAVYRQAQAHIDAEMAAIAGNPAAYRRRSQLLAMQTRINALMDQVDQQARAWIENDLPAVYELGASRAQQQIADAISSLSGQPAPTLDGYNQVPRLAVNRLAGDLFENLLDATDGIRSSTKGLIRDLVRSAAIDTVVTGTPALEASRSLARTLEDNGIRAVTYRDGSRVDLDTYAEMAVRTSSALIYNQGTLDEATGAGVDYMEVFDGENCGWLEHEDPDLADGSIRTLADCEDNPIAHPNCVASGTRVLSWSGVEAATRALYDGPMVVLSTAALHVLTVTPHHPILTDRGWIAAANVHSGDHVLGHSDWVEAVAASGLDLDDRPPSIDEVFDALGVHRSPTLAVATPPDFHGDAAGFMGEVDVVRADSELTDETGQMAEEHQLVGARAQGRSVLGPGPPLQRLRGVPLATTSLVGGVDGRCVSRSRSDDDAPIPEPIEDGAAANADLGRQIGRRLSCEVTLHEIVEVRYLDRWHGHVLDLTTTVGAYIAAGLVVHNCRRGFGPRPDIVSDEQAAAAQEGDVPPEEQSLAEQLGLPVTGVSDAVAFGFQDEAAQQSELVAQANLDRHAQRLQSRRDRLDARNAARAPAVALDEPGEAAASLVAEAAAIEPGITTDVTDLAGAAGGTMEGLDFRLKTEDSLRRKIVSDQADDPAKSFTEIANQVGDVLRYTTTFESGSYVEGVTSMADALRARGYRFGKVKNTWFPDTNPYRELNSQVLAPTGERFELQFHTPESFALKQASHGPYERVRSLPADSPEREVLARQMADDARLLDAPDGVDGLSIDTLG